MAEMVSLSLPHVIVELRRTLPPTRWGELEVLLQPEVAALGNTMDRLHAICGPEAVRMAITRLVQQQEAMLPPAARPAPSVAAPGAQEGPAPLAHAFRCTTPSCPVPGCSMLSAKIDRLRRHAAECTNSKDTCLRCRTWAGFKQYSEGGASPGDSGDGNAAAATAAAGLGLGAAPVVASTVTPRVMPSGGPAGKEARAEVKRAEAEAKRADKAAKKAATGGRGRGGKRKAGEMDIPIEGVTPFATATACATPFSSDIPLASVVGLVSSGAGHPGLVPPMEMSGTSFSHLNLAEIMGKCVSFSELGLGNQSLAELGQGLELIPNFSAELKRHGHSISTMSLGAFLDTVNAVVGDGIGDSAPPAGGPGLPLAPVPSSPDKKRASKRAAAAAPTDGRQGQLAPFPCAVPGPFPAKARAPASEASCASTTELPSLPGLPFDRAFNDSNGGTPIGAATSMFPGLLFNNQRSSSISLKDSLSFGSSPAESRSTFETGMLTPGLSPLGAAAAADMVSGAVGRRAAPADGWGEAERQGASGANDA